MYLNSILNYYPCGAYKLTKDGKISVCQYSNNLSQQGAGYNKLNQLYTKGYIEGYQNYGEYKEYILYIVLIIMIVIILIK